MLIFVLINYETFDFVSKYLFLLNCFALSLFRSIQKKNVCIQILIKNMNKCKFNIWLCRMSLTAVNSLVLY